MTGKWRIFKVFDLQDFIQGLQLRSLKDADEESDLWPQVNAMLRQVGCLMRLRTH